MLNKDSNILAHQAQNVSLLALSLLFLPIDTCFVCLCYLWTWAGLGKVGPRALLQRDGMSVRDKTRPCRRVLVTGVGMTKGLVLARAFHQAGHVVIGADFEPNGSLSCARASKVLAKFVRLRQPTQEAGSAPYIQSLLSLVLEEKIDLWISCSGVASAVEDGEAKEVLERRTPCKAIQFDVATTQTLHEKHSFIKYTERIGLTVPETHEITSRKAVNEILGAAKPGRRYIMKTVGMDDSNRADMTLLPKGSEEETARHLDRLVINAKSPWILQQFIGGPEFCTHTVIVEGQVKVFVGCPSSELLMHYQALPQSSPINQAMLEFTRQYADNGGRDFTGHLSFDFLVDEKEADGSNQPTIYPIECNPRAHTAVALFAGTGQMVEAYLSALDVPDLQQTDASLQTVLPIYPSKNNSYYWVGHDLVEHAILPLLRLLTRESSILEFAINIKTFLEHVLFWKDGTFEVWDPIPWWWLYHVYWPMQFWNALITGKKWSRINVSTTKMFMC